MPVIRSMRHEIAIAVVQISVNGTGKRRNNELDNRIFCAFIRGDGSHDWSLSNPTGGVFFGSRVDFAVTIHCPQWAMVIF